MPKVVNYAARFEFLRRAAADGDQSAVELLRLIDGDLTSDEALAEAVAGLREHPVTAESWLVARQWANEAIDALAPLPEGVVKDSLSSFALAVVDRAS